MYRVYSGNLLFSAFYYYLGGGGGGGEGAGVSPQRKVGWKTFYMPCMSVFGVCRACLYSVYAVHVCIR